MATKPPVTKRPWFWVVIGIAAIFAILVVIGAVIGSPQTDAADSAPATVISTATVTETQAAPVGTSVTVTATVTPDVTNTHTVSVTATTLISKTIEQTVIVTAEPQHQTIVNGDYLVGTDIATGVWRCSADGGSLYWETDTKSGDIIDNDLGSIARVPTSAYSVTLRGCDGDWAKVD